MRPQNCTIRRLVSWMDCDQFGGLAGTITRMKQAEPEFLMGRTFSLAIDAFGMSKSIHSDADYKRDLDILLADASKMGNLREKRHAKAVKLFAEGEMQSACVEWEKILAEHPNDLMAIKFSNDTYFFSGDFPAKRDNVARVLPKWDKNAPCYSHLHGMHAFGLEECGEYAEAEKHARIALNLQQMDCWATHAMAHCFEMASNFGDGIRFLESTEMDWAPAAGNFIACHNYWHLILFFIEKGDFEAALTIYDKEVGRRTSSETGTILNLTDASSVLARLELEGVQVGRERWEAIAGLADQQTPNHLLAFNDAHIALVLNRIKPPMARKHAESMEQFAENTVGDNARIIRDIGINLCDAIADFHAEQYERAFDSLYPIRTQLYRISGSNAQRDLFIQLLLHAGFRSECQERRAKALIALEERNAMKPNSAVAQRLLYYSRSA